MKTDENFIMMPVPASMFVSVCALIGAAALAAPSGNRPAPQRADEPQPAAEPAPVASGGEPATGTDGETDAHGHPWSADLHAATRGKTKDGLWRMKVGVSRPAPLPGFPVAGTTGTSENGAASGASGSAATGGASNQTATTGGDDDEFAAFRAAAAKSDAAGAAAAAAVAPRKWTDADLGALCNQAAVKLGDPSPVKALIAEYVPEGQVAHSRHIPEGRREAFGKAVEAKAGIEFAG